MGYIVPISDLQHQARAAWRTLPGWIRAEVIDEHLYILPRPTTYHALTITNISATLIEHIVKRDLGTLCLGEVDVFLNKEANSVVPDILFVAKGNQEASVERKGVVGAPDLIIEVLSPGNRRHDLVVKKELYEKAGVKEYWIIDPDTKDAQGYLLRDSKYETPLSMNSELYIRILRKNIKF